MRKVFLSLWLDTRHKKLNGTYPVKLRLFCQNPRKQKLYTTVFEFTKEDFASIYETTKPRNEYKELRKKLFALEQRGNDVLDSLRTFSFEEFEAIMDGASTKNAADVFNLFDTVVEQKLSIGSVSTAEKYSLAKTCINKYLKHQKRKDENEKEFEPLTFDEITIEFINKFKHYCENKKSLSAATIGIYLRNLRSIYRLAIENGTTTFDSYPFGKNKAQIPTSKKVNKALTQDELKLLWHNEPKNENQSFAKDFWFFSYYAYGMNTKDICELKHTSIDGNSIHYIRSKTKNTKKERTIKEVPLTHALKQIIEKRKKTTSPYLFGILNTTDTYKQQRNKVARFNDTIVRNIREFALDSGINPELAEKIGTYHARHSFATVAVRSGKSIALISEILHDGNLKTTENYINSFPKEAYKNLSLEMEL
jgi:hypothetical protein